MGFFSGLVKKIAAPLVGGLFSAKGTSNTNQSNLQIAREANQFNANQAKINRQFQERMSNTAHQREVHDLRAAGLNPILSANTGASSPAGNMATANMATMQDAVTTGLNTAMSMANTQSDINLKEANKALAEVNETLRQALVPGAEGVAAVTEQLANLAKAAANLFGSNQAGYEEGLTELTQGVEQLVEHARQSNVDVGKAARTAIEELSKSGNENAAVKFIKQWWNDFNIKEYFQ
jgi:molybdenum-dependent DNA-binding transcriptional regulator ModE